MAKQLRAALTAMILGVLLSGCQKNQAVLEDGRSELLSAETETETSQDTTTALPDTELIAQEEISETVVTDTAQNGTASSLAEETENYEAADADATQSGTASPLQEETENYEAADADAAQSRKTSPLQEETENYETADVNAPQSGTASPLQEETESSLPEETEENSLETNADGVAILNFDDMYSSASSSRGLQFSEAFLALEGKTVQISGYMAPPLKPVFNFFVLSKQPMAICPFCSSDADWPEDIVAIYVEEGEKSVANDTLLTITGTLELGSYTDEDTGFVSQARIYADSIMHNR